MRRRKYAVGDSLHLDHQEHYLKTGFNIVGIHEISIIRAEGLNLGDFVSSQAITDAPKTMH